MHQTQMKTTESKRYFSHLTKSTIIFFVSFASMVFVDKTNYESIYFMTVVLVIVFHFASIFFISSFVSSTGRSGFKYALGAFLVPFWGDGVVYYLCRNIAIQEEIV